MEAVYQKYLFEEHFPFDVYITASNEFPPHWHEDFEVIYCMGDYMKVGIKDEIHLLKQGDICIVDANEIHYFPHQPYACNRMILQFKGTHLGMYSDFEAGMHFKTPVIHKDNIEGSFHSLLEHNLMAILSENDRMEKGFKMSIMARLYDVVSLLYRNIELEQFSKEELNHSHLRLGRLEKVFDYVESHYSERITLEDIASVAGYSVYHFTRFFKEFTGMTFITYLNYYRIYMASFQLQDTDLQVTEIALEVGYESVKTFNRVFKEVKGCSPTVFRKQNMRS